ncbi:phosphatidate cytidylyltransferase [Paraflavisolibacter sp. H34]|uniref:phosphatidate cytidylyltransferase n=1 Tax=Huijunlia imazamoxiresistens TaxID=3127457 RepID=UPI00301A092C
MKPLTSVWILLFALAMTLTSCQLVEGIFKAGFYSAFIVIILVVGLIIFLISRFRR